MAQRFNSINGGVVDSVIAGLGNNVSTNILNIGSGQNASFGINSVLGGVVQDTTGYYLNEGQNYLLSQLGSTLGNSAQSALVNAVTTQIATAGINQAISFVSQVIPNPFLGGSNVTLAGLGAQAARSTISIPDSVASQLEDADYGGSAYTLEDIVFTLVPANAGAQTQLPPQTAPTTSWDVGFDAEASKSIPAIDGFKTVIANEGFAKGQTVGGRNFGAAYTTLGGRASQVKPVGSSIGTPMKVNW
jgi:hypothetical protein